MGPALIAARTIGQMVVIALRTMRGALVSVTVSMERFAATFARSARSMLASSKSAFRNRKSALKRVPKHLKSRSDDWGKLDAKTKRSWGLLNELPDRMNAISRMTPYIAAAETYWGLMERLPAGPRYGAYRRSLRVVRVGGKKERGGSFAVVGEPTPLKDRAIDSARQVIYVRPKKSFSAPVSKSVRILHKFSPWTMETLPFSPKKNEAVMIVRRVSKREVKSVTQQRNKDRPEWRKQLEAAGVRNVRVAEKAPELKTKVVNDLAFDALRLEFGYGGIKPVPHWRPSVTESVRYIRRLYKRRSMFSKAMSEPRFQAWRKWPPRTESSIKISDLKALRRFSKRLKIRLSS